MQQRAGEVPGNEVTSTILLATVFEHSKQLSAICTMPVQFKQQSWEPAHASHCLVAHN